MTTRAPLLLRRTLLLGGALLLAGTALAADGNGATRQPAIHLSHRVLSDGLSQSNPKALPGSTIEYEIAVTDFAGIAAADNRLSITTPVPAHLTLVVAGEEAGRPSYQLDGHSAETIGPCDMQIAGDCVAFSNDGGRSFDYRPSPDIDGVDREITHFRFNIRTAGSSIPLEMARLRLRYRMIME